MAEKNMDYYVNLPYSFIIDWSDADGCFLGSIAELERNMTCGGTREEVLANLNDALVSYIATSLGNNMEIPEPLNVKDFKGNIAYRTSSERHYLLAKQAKLCGKSINAFIDETIAEKLNVISGVAVGAEGP
ncbi:MAG: type II toxin-antitoxin system HicB family antitoxin [Treponema sp.]|nr:type II toxin-antitoxin system HicB family antitoxin [Treponema sp.]